MESRIAGVHGILLLTRCRDRWEAIMRHATNRPNREVFMHFFGMEVTWK